MNYQERLKPLVEQITGEQRKSTPESRWLMEVAKEIASREERSVDMTEKRGEIQIDAGTNPRA